MIEVISSMLSDYNEIKIEIDKNQISRKTPNIWKLNSMLQHNLSAEEKITREIRKYEMN